MANGARASSAGPRYPPRDEVGPRPIVPVSRADSGIVRLYGPLALALFLLASSKWGSYLPAGSPPYVTDLALAALLLARAAQAAAPVAARRPERAMVEPFLWVSVSALLLWTGITFVFGSVTQNALRDAAPYAYAVVIFLVRPIPREAEHVVARAITAALVFHAAWVTLVQLSPSVASSTPTLGGIHIFYLRTDFDSVACGLLASLSLHRALSNRHPVRNLLLAGWGTALVLTLISRAGLLAFATQLLLVLFLAPARRAAGARDNRLVLALIIACVPLMVLSLSQSKSVQRLSALSSGNTLSSETQIRAAGSARARSESWRVLVRYLQSNPRRGIAGVGFGPDFLHDSGADLLLLGATNQDVRSPHNYLLNTWARLGLVGLVLVLSVIAAGFRLVLLVRRHIKQLSDQDVLALLIVASIPIAALLGVILESPFGAVPYFWALGHLSVRAIQSGVLRSFALRAAPDEPLPHAG